VELRVQIVAVVTTGLLLIGVLELVRRRRLLERYALLWIFSTTVLLALAAWKGLLTDLAVAVGIYYAPSALFVFAVGFVLILLLHFSVAVSRLAEQSKVLAQRMALAEERQQALEAREESLDSRRNGRIIGPSGGFGSQMDGHSTSGTADKVAPPDDRSLVSSTRLGGSAGSPR
jgi:hypothetical protein